MAAAGEGQYFQAVMRTGLCVRSVIVSAVFSRAMVLSSKGRKGRSAGKMVNLLSSDAESLQQICQSINTAWSAPLRIIIAIVRPDSVKLWGTFEISAAPWKAPRMNRFGKPWTWMPWSERMPPSQASESFTPLVPVTSKPSRLVWSVPTSKPEA